MMTENPLDLVITDPEHKAFISISPEHYKWERITTDSYYGERLTNSVEFSYYIICEHGSGIVGDWYATADELQRLGEAVRSFSQKESDSISFTVSGDDEQRYDFFTIDATRENGFIDFSITVTDEALPNLLDIVKTAGLSEEEFSAYADKIILWSTSFPIKSYEELEDSEERHYRRNFL